jgi:hypothetical protein
LTGEMVNTLRAHEYSYHSAAKDVTWVISILKSSMDRLIAAGMGLPADANSASLQNYSGRFFLARIEARSLAQDCSA